MHLIRDMQPSARPRERLLDAGVSSLGDDELVAVLLRTGRRGHDAVSAARELLAESGGLVGLARLEPEALLLVPGIGAAKAATLVAAVELGRRLARAGAPRQSLLDTPAQVAAFLVPRLAGARSEVVGIVCLDHRNRLLRCRDLVRGTRTSAPVDPAELFRAALLDGAAGVVVFHTHPSGDPTPSRDDLELTRRLAAAGEVVGIALLDHLVVAGSAWLSLRSSHPDLFAAPPARASAARSPS